VPAAATPRLYDTNADPVEKKDLAKERPLERRAMADAFYTYLASRKDWNKTRWGVPSNLRAGYAKDRE
jgi:hypothetical protein